MLGKIIRGAIADPKYVRAGNIIRQLALTGCRRGEIINLTWDDVDLDDSCLRLTSSKEGASVRVIGLPVVEYLEAEFAERHRTYVFPGQRSEYGAIGNFPTLWLLICVEK